MGLFKPDLYRAFAVGFALGAVVLFFGMGDQARSQWAARVIPAAVAATLK